MFGHEYQRVNPAGKGRQCNGLESAATHFFRIMLPSIVQDKKLRIPKRFITKFGDELSLVVRLHVPNGSAWNVKVDKVGKEIHFKDGWHEFVQHYSIKEYYFLVFKYRGNSSFDVVIFDLSTTEICYDQEEPLHGKQCPISHHQEEMEDIEDDDDDSIEILGSSVPSLRFDPKLLEKKKPTLGGCSNPPTKRNFNTNTTTCGQNAVSLKNKEFKREYMTRTKRAKMDHVNESSPSNVKTEIGPDQFKNKKPKSETNEDEKLAGDGEEGGCHGTKTIPRGSLMKKPVMTRKGEEAIKAAIMYKPENPSFRRSYNIRLSNSTSVPAKFARKCVTGCSKIIKLRGLDGREWWVQCIHTVDRWRISKGWPAFVQENELEEGDVVVFELIQGAEIVVKVTIFRANEDGGS